MSENRIKMAPDTVAYADRGTHKLVVEFAIPGAPTDSIDVKILGDSIHLTAPAKDIEYVAALALAWPVKPDKAEAIYEHGLLRIEVPFKDPMEDAVKVTIKTSRRGNQARNQSQPKRLRRRLCAAQARWPANRPWALSQRTSYPAPRVCRSGRWR